MTTFEPPPTAGAQLVLDAARRAAAYIETMADRGVTPTEEALAALSQFGHELGETPVPASAVLELLDGVGSPATVLTTGGRYFGYVQGGTEPVGRAASVLIGAWDQNVALAVMSPVAALLDEIASRWCAELLLLPEGSIAAFCSGASVANLTSIIVARDALLARVGWDVAQRGLHGAPPLRVVATAELHASVVKALRLAGVGTDQVEWVSTDECGRARADGFADADARTLVLLQAGNVNTGHSDPFEKIIPVAHAAGAWVHIDGAFGLWANASPAQRHFTAGSELADSWATDAHKWLNAPYDCGVVICRYPDALRRSMALDAAYITSDDDRSAAHLGLQLSQRARGAEVWAILAHHGRSGVAELVDRLCARAQQMARLLGAAGVDVLVPVALNQVLVRFDNDDGVTDAVIGAVQADRTCWVGGTTWKSLRAMRISICDTSTDEDGVVAAANAIVRCWQASRPRRVASAAVRCRLPTQRQGRDACQPE